MPHVNIASVGVTEAPRPTSLPDGVPIGVFPSPAPRGHPDDDHIRGRRRVFIGPMPENIAARLRVGVSSGSGHVGIPSSEFAEEDFARDDIACDEDEEEDTCSNSKARSKDHSESDSECERTASPLEKGKISRRQLLREFISRGGNREHFSEREIWKAWHKAGWSQVPLPADASTRRWVGTSFEVGVDVVAGMSSRLVAPIHPLRDDRGEIQVGGAQGDPTSRPSPSRGTTADTFFTAYSSSQSDEEDFIREDGRKKGKARLDSEPVSQRLASKVSLAVTESGGPSSQVASATRRADIPPSGSPFRSGPSRQVDIRPRSTLGITSTSGEQKGVGLQSVSESNLPAMLNPTRGASLAPTPGLRSALRRRFSTLKEGTAKQRSVIFAESPQPLSTKSVDPFNKLPHSAPAPPAPSAPAQPSENQASPAEVLNRESGATDATSAGAVVAFQAQLAHVPDDGIVLRGKRAINSALLG